MQDYFPFLNEQYAFLVEPSTGEWRRLRSRFRSRSLCELTPQIGISTDISLELLILVIFKTL